MTEIQENIQKIIAEIPSHVQLVAVSKTHPNQAIIEALEINQFHFGENKVQELTQKAESLPKKIFWHMIGHLQSNKVKYIVDFVHLVHGVDKEKLLKEIDKRADQNHKKVNILLQMHIAKEDTKFGFDTTEIRALLDSDLANKYPNVIVKGLMGMATFTENKLQIAAEFKELHKIFEQYKTYYPNFDTLSMGMSNDYKIAIDEGSNLIRVGSNIFGNRNYN